MEEHDIGECYYFLTMSNPDRVKLLVGRHIAATRGLSNRSPSSLTSSTDTLTRVTAAPSPDNHQVLCAPWKIYEEALPGPRDGAHKNVNVPVQEKSLRFFLMLATHML